MPSGVPDIDLTSLRWSTVVAKSGGFRSAAALLGVEQSAVSRRIRHIEDELGVSLFQRGVRGAAPTNAGEVFLRRVEGLLQGLGVAVSDAQAAGRGQVGRLRIGLTFSFLSDALFHLIDRFHAAHPRVFIEMIEGRAGDHLDAVASRRLDVAVLPGGMTVSGLDVSVLWRERLLIAVPQDHPLALAQHVHVGDLDRVRLLVSERDVGRSPFIDAAGRFASGPEVITQETGAALLLEQTRMGLGLTLIGSGSLKGLRLDGGLVFRPLMLEPDTPLTVAAAWSSENDNPVLRRFVSAARRTERAPPAASD